MDNIWAWLGSIVLTIGVVWKAMEKWSPKIRWSLKLMNETHDAIEAILSACEDRKITKQEIENIRNEVEDIQDILANN